MMMNKIFKPKLYVFGNEARPEIENFFGTENLEFINLDEVDDLEDRHADALWKVSRNPYAEFVYSDYMHLTIVNNYEQDKLTFLHMSGLPDRFFKVDSEEEGAKLEAMAEIIQYRIDLDFASDDINRSLGTIVDESEHVFEGEVCLQLKDHLRNINDLKDGFDDLVAQSLDEAINQFEVLIM